MPSFRCSLLVVVLLVVGTAVHAQHPAEPPPTAPAIEGTWSGTLELSTQSLDVIFQIQTGADTSATMDVPAQGARGISASTVRITPDSLILAVAAINGRYAGTRHADRIEGTWMQNGMTWPLVLMPVPDSLSTAPARPQTPTPPFPYDREDMTLQSADGVTLAGTLTRPTGDGPHPAVVLVSGSGPHTRDSEVMGHKLFRVVADHLARQGIAAFRYDERGVGASDGVFSRATYDDFAADVHAAVQMLAARDDIASVGVYGHSEGGLIAPMVAARSEAVDFLVLLAPPGVPGREIIPEQTAQIVAAQGAPSMAVDSVRAQQTRVMDALYTAADSAAATARVRRILERIGLPSARINAQLRVMMSGWYRSFVQSAPAEVLRQVEVPVLALFAEKDLQILPEQNRAPLEAALNDSDSPSVTVETLSGMNHLFQPADTGVPSEYRQIETTMAPAVLERITAWIQSHNKTN